MTSTQKLEANRRNAKLSTGPRDTTRTRLNALKHGILSNDTLILAGDGKEELEVFEEFRRQLRDDLTPIGALEEFLVDNIVMLAWRWRRLLRYEASIIGENGETATEGPPQPRTQDLVALAEEAEKDMEAINNGKPLENRPETWYRLFSVAAEKFQVPISELLELDNSWRLFCDYDEEQVRQVMSEACQKGNISEAQFWVAVRDSAHLEHEEASKQLKRLNCSHKRERPLASLPDEKALMKIQRYEAHLSRQFYKALHELQRVQSARAGQRPLAPLAIDVDLGQPGA